MKTALITGVTGQDGTYLAESLSENGCTVYGAMLRTRSFTVESSMDFANAEGGFVLK
jgi:GDPmannose 4,6-dehydratase